MTLKEAMAAQKALDSLMQEQHSYKLAYGLAKAKKKLASSVEFYAEKERELFNQYAEKDDSGNIKINDVGELRIPTEHLSEFIAKHNELDAVDIEFEVCHIDDFPETIRGADLEALEGVVEFKEPD